MAMEAATPVPSPSAQLVGNAFVEQYYPILHKNPEFVFRFYIDSSVLTRPGPDGVMTSVSSTQAINDLIVSLDYADYKAEIKTVDAQNSHKDGVVVLVTGCLTGKDDVKRKFTQSFFLAPQDKGYYVLNDIFRYVEEDNSLENNTVSINGVPESIQSTPVTADIEPVQDSEQPVVEQTIPVVEMLLSNGDVDHEQPETVNGIVVEEEAVVVPVFSAPAPAPAPTPAPVEVHPAPIEVHSVSEPSLTVQEEAPKKSYASIVKHAKEARPIAVYVPTGAVKVANSAGKVSTNAGKVAAATAEQKSVAAVPETAAPNSNITPEVIHPEEVEGYSIYIRSLPLNATVAQVEEEFKKFGSIRPNGVQVRSNKGFCFGFVEFENISSVNSALEASPVTVGGRDAHVEEKKTTTRVGSGGRPRFPPGRGGFRNDNFRGRGNFSGGRGYGRNDYGRNEYGNRSDFSGRRGPSSGRGGEGYQRVENGNGRVGRQSGANSAPVAA